MTPQYIKQALDHLGKSHFNRTWPVESLEAIYQNLANYNDQSMIAAIKIIRLDISPSTFPALKRVIEIVDQEQAKINMLQSPAEPLSRRENDKQFKSVFGDMADKHSQLAMRLCMKIADGMLEPGQIIEACQHMETKFPNVGWKDTMTSYIRKFQTDNKTVAANG